MNSQEQQQTSTSQQPISSQQQTEGIVFPEEKHHSLIWILVTLFFLIVLIGAGVFVLPKTTLFQSLIATPPSPTGVVSGKNQAKTIDMSPSMPANQKTVVLIELSDSSFEKVIMANALVAAYIKNLPEGDQVISQTPLGK